MTVLPNTVRAGLPALPPPSLGRAPLAPVAFAVTAGILLDRSAGLPPALALLAAAGALLAWVAVRAGSAPLLPVLYGCVFAAGLAAFYHHYRRDVYAEDDIGRFAEDEEQAVLLRGDVDEEPHIWTHADHNPLLSISPGNTTRTVLRVEALKQGQDQVRVSGRASLTIPGRLDGLHVGDRIEVTGRLARPQEPANPGEADYAARLRDQGITAQVAVRRTSATLHAEEAGWFHSPAGLLARLRGWGQRTLLAELPRGQGDVATALLLGEGSTMTPREWEKYRRAGVIHALAISGQHLLVLAGFLWFIPRQLGWPRRRTAWLVALVLLGYALLTGGRPPALRAAVVVAVLCGGDLLRRPAMQANSLALAWILVALVNPTDLFDAGCQLSFLSSVLLYWGVSRWFRRETDPLDRLIDEARPAWLRALRGLGWRLAVPYLVTAILWTTLSPLVACRYHILSPIALLFGPPVTFLACIALITGFLLLLAAAACPPLVPLFAWLTSLGLAGCDFFVTTADSLHSYQYVPNIPAWWVIGFYVGLLSVLWIEPLRRRRRWLILGGLTWLCIGLLATLRFNPPEMRCTFLAVGHGGCAVIETPDGRVFLYDAGALQGPDMANRQIAPFLWQRGISRIDEVFLSHADLDHFNGLPDLLERFRIGQVTLTPTFAEKPTEGVQLTTGLLERLHIPVRLVAAGDHLQAGEVSLDVLHPPPSGLPGNENAHSMVLLMRHAGHSLLLTGDLADAGLERVLNLPPVAVDVLQAPHHGSRTANTPQLARWARPRVVVSCQGPPQFGERRHPYSEALFLGTWPDGAITIRSSAEGLSVETFQTRQVIKLQ